MMKIFDNIQDPIARFERIECEIHQIHQSHQRIISIIQDIGSAVADLHEQNKILNQRVLALENQDLVK